MTIHSWCVVRSMRENKGHDEKGRGRGRLCMSGCGNRWGVETFRTAKAMVRRAHQMAALEDQKDPARHVPACLEGATTSVNTGVFTVNTGVSMISS